MKMGLRRFNGSGTGLLLVYRSRDEGTWFGGQSVEELPYEDSQLKTFIGKVVVIMFAITSLLS
jgi:hypothetical protein